ncbi:ferrous iron transport protein A [Tyzzerella sp. An114]|uniref:FeoA family protein n=1 Tax=Tyzzerella sp. An114 TaxID=1965545 RepID=UPI000B4350D6|nr:ferrous iron transport protein A [Tyzzerella sp. An114]OUQ59518.1 ferrous iron transport protein A [Tyzzerella sp. An114]HIT72663.1 ferrous iron transport protein A [Candidatus Fimicola cottocaccae]
MYLLDLKDGESKKVVSINAEYAMKKRLIDMGITRGTVLTKVKTAPLGDPIEIKLRGYDLTLRKDEAAKIVME